MFGTWIKAERQRRGWTQARLAELSGLAQTYVSGLERGQYTNPSADVLRGLAAAFEIPVGTLLAVAGSAPVDTAPYLAALRDLGVPEDRIAKLLRAAENLTAADWDWLIATAEQRRRQNERHPHPHPDPPALARLT